MIDNYFSHEYNELNSLSNLFFQVLKGGLLSNGLLAILDEDMAYAKALSDYISRSASLGFSACTFSNVDEFINVLQKKTIEVLLIDESLYSSINSKVKDTTNNIVIICVLASKKNVVYNDPTFFKYQSAESLLHSIMSSFSTNLSGNIAYNSSVENSLCQPSASPFKTSANFDSTSLLSAVYSPIGRCGKTIFAYTYATILSLEEPTLFISFDEYSRFLYKDCGNDLSDLLFFYLEDKNCMNTKLSSIVCKQGSLDVIVSAKYGADLRNLDSKDIYRFVSSLKQSQYKNIVLDLGDTLCDPLPLLHLCQKIFVPKLEDSISIHKLSSFISTLSTLDTSLSSTRLSFVDVPAFYIEEDLMPLGTKLLVSPVAEYINTHILGQKND